MTETGILAKIREGEDIANFIGRPFNTILFNDNTHTMIEVTNQLKKATGYSDEKVEGIMLEAHNNGRAIVITAHQEKCEHVAAILDEIRLGTKVEPA
jgi:ATP-dependent Clp protease adapter protein ClpS